jgi:hypothetical protein
VITASKRLVAENAALRSAVEAVWRGDSVDILDFEFGSKDPPGSSSDESTCSDKQLSSLYATSICSRLSISSRMDTPSASSDDEDHSEVLEVQSQDCLEDNRLADLTSAPCSCHEDEPEAPSYNIFQQSQDFTEVDVVADLTPVSLTGLEDELQDSKDELQDSMDTNSSQCGDGHEDEPEAPASDIFLQSQDLTEVDDVVDLTPVNFAISEDEPQDSKDELQDSTDTICAQCGDGHEDEPEAPAYNIPPQSHDFADIDDVADLTLVSFAGREDELQDSKDALQDSIHTICAQFGDGHEDEPETPTYNILSQSQDSTGVGDVAHFTPVSFAGREDELQDSKDERQDSADAICAACGDVHVFGRPAWCRNLN